MLTICTVKPESRRFGDFLFFFFFFQRSNFIVILFLLDSIFKQHYYFKTTHLIRSLVFLYFASESPNLTRIQTHDLCIGHVALTQGKNLHIEKCYPRIRSTSCKNRNIFYRHLLLIKAWCCRADANINALLLRRRDNISYSALQHHTLFSDKSR